MLKKSPYLCWKTRRVSCRPLSATCTNRSCPTRRSPSPGSAGSRAARSGAWGWPPPSRSSVCTRPRCACPSTSAPWPRRPSSPNPFRFRTGTQRNVCSHAKPAVRITRNGPELLPVTQLASPLRCRKKTVSKQANDDTIFQMVVRDGHFHYPGSTYHDSAVTSDTSKHPEPLLYRNNAARPQSPITLRLQVTSNPAGMSYDCVRNVT